MKTIVATLIKTMHYYFAFRGVWLLIALLIAIYVTRQLSDFKR